MGDFFGVVLFQVTGVPTPDMARKERKYKRMPGRPFAPFEVRSLWQGPDHLLWVETVFFKEYYKRFSYADIQSIILQRTDAHVLWSCIWGILALICGLIAFLVTDTPFISGFLTMLFLMLLGANVVLGPACTVYLQTAAQVQKISSLKRVKTARKAMARIKALVEAAQGAWDDRNSGMKATPSSVPSPANQASSAGMPAGTLIRSMEAAVTAPFKPLLHQILFGLLLALGVMGTIQLQLRNLPMATLETLLHLVAQVMVIVALTRWHRLTAGTLINKINWVALVFITLFTIIGYGLYLAASFSNPQVNYHHWVMFKKVFELQWIEHPLTLAANVTYACGNVFLGCFGLLVLRRRPAGPNP
jgi:hypothetical protein